MKKFSCKLAPYVDDVDHTTDKMVFARYGNFELDIMPVPLDFDPTRGPIGHLDFFEHTPLWKKDLIRLLKA